MGCLYGIVKNFVQKKYEDNDDDEFKDCPDWNLLVFDMTLWIFQRSPESQIKSYPFIPNDGATVWGAWFGKVLGAVGGEFYDATPNMVYNCLKNCPHEDVAQIVFDTIGLNDIKEYLGEGGADIKPL